MADKPKGDQAEPTYEVGYGKPPKHTQFKSGHGVKSPGRPKGSRSTQQEVAALLNGDMVVRIGGRAKKMNRRKALIQSLFERAAKGNNRAVEILLKLEGVGAEQGAGAASPVPHEVTAADRALLRAKGFLPREEDEQ